MYANYSSPWLHEIIGWCFLQCICIRTLIYYWTKQQIWVFMTKHVLLLDDGNAICSHMRNTRDSKRSEQHPWVMGTATCWAFRAQVPQSGPSKSPVLQLIPLSLHLKLFHWTLCCTQHMEDIFTFLHEVCRAWLSVQDFPNKIMTYPCHVVSRCGNHRPCHSNPCVNEEC